MAKKVSEMKELQIVSKYFTSPNEPTITETAGHTFTASFTAIVAVNFSVSIIL